MGDPRLRQEQESTHKPILETRGGIQKSKQGTASGGGGLTLVKLTRLVCCSVSEQRPVMKNVERLPELTRKLVGMTACNFCKHFLC